MEGLPISVIDKRAVEVVRVPRHIARRTEAAIVRSLLVVLAAAAWWLGNAPSDPSIGYLAGAYAVVIAAGWLAAVFERPWLTYVGAVVDVAAVTAFAWLVGSTLFWPLYVVPLAAAGATGLWPLIMAGGLSMAGYFSAVLFLSAGLAPTTMWPAAAIVVTSVALGLLPSSWLNAVKERRAWAQVAGTQETLRRSDVLADAGTRAQTFDAAVVREAVVAAVVEGLDAVAAVVDLEDRAVLAGDRELGEDALSRNLHHANLGPSFEARLGRITLSLGPHVMLVVHRPSIKFADEEHRWLSRLAAAGRAALDRCSEHRQLQAEKNRLHGAWEASPAPAALHTPSGQLVLANDAYLALNLEHVDVLPSADEPDQLEAKVGDPPRVFILTKIGVAGGDYVLLLYREITRQRQAIEARDGLLSLVGHELRGPLTSIHGFSQLMVRNLSVVQQQVAQIDRLIGDLMSKSALESGQLALDVEEVDLGELARAAAERLRAAQPDRALALGVTRQAKVRADPTRLNQVIDNLLSNASKYSPAEAPIGLGVDATETEALLWVTDRGVGIAEEHLSRLFDRFYRVPAEGAQQVKGLGLGLSLVRDLVAAHGGRVWAESPGLGLGSTFRVSLPRA
jgi:signal transduction histidine kinase